MTRRETLMLGDCKIRACKCWIISSVCIWTRSIQLMKVKDKSHLQFLCRIPPAVNCGLLMLPLCLPTCFDTASIWRSDNAAPVEFIIVNRISCIWKLRPPFAMHYIPKSEQPWLKFSKQASRYLYQVLVIQDNQYMTTPMCSIQMMNVSIPGSSTEWLVSS